MTEQQLLSELAIAERNMKKKSSIYSVTFFKSVTDAFRRTDTHSFADLVRKDVKGALALRELALKEKLL
jgi:hypothetical protein